MKEKDVKYEEGDDDLKKKKYTRKVDVKLQGTPN